MANTIMMTVVRGYSACFNLLVPDSAQPGQAILYLCGVPLRQKLRAVVEERCWCLPVFVQWL